MPDDNKNQDTNTQAAGADSVKDQLDQRIQAEKEHQDRLKNDPAAAAAAGLKTDTEGDDPNKITVDRSYITALREEAKENRVAADGIKTEMQDLRNLLKTQFGVDSAEQLAEKMKEDKLAKEREEESKLSKLELAEKKRAEVEKKMEELAFQSDAEKSDLKSQRDDIIIENALIQTAVAMDVVNAKQLIRLLKDEFFVDPNDLTPKYQAEDGIMSLEQRVKVFLEDQDNWNLVRGRMTPGSGTQTAGAGGPNKPTFTRAELKDMRNNKPDEYKSRQVEIQKAYAEGRVT